MKAILFAGSLLFAYLKLVSLDEVDEKPGGPYVYRNTRPSQTGKIPEWDSNGYILFCLCMGRTGNQMEHLLGGMAFAKSINRTLVLPPFRTYRNIRFTEWFKFEPMEEFHRVVLAEDFMEFLAPSHWPPGQRAGFCWQAHDTTVTDCKMKEGNPFGPFWDDLKVDFDESIIYHLSYNDEEIPKWKTQYPAEKYPVLAMRGAPASFPVPKKFRPLQRHLVFSDRIVEEAEKYIENNFPNETFVGIHLRNGADWVNVCNNAKGQRSYMASPQCLEGTSQMVTANLCLPSKSEILRLTRNAVTSAKAKVVFVATDKEPMISEITEHLKDKKVRVYHADPHLPLIDSAILIKAHHFIGNCVSSFTSFVKRARDVEGVKPTSFWGLD